MARAAAADWRRRDNSGRQTSGCKALGAILRAPHGAGATVGSRAAVVKSRVAGRQLSSSSVKFRQAVSSFVKCNQGFF
jgi:hypothetical protein